MLTHLLASLVGIWLMAAPSALGYPRPAATNDWIVGPLIATFGIVACWGATRSLRWANVVLAGWLLVAPLPLKHPIHASLNSIACGVAVIGLSLVRGKLKHQFGAGWAGAWRSPTDICGSSA
jgi:hypothetical protein